MTEGMNVSNQGLGEVGTIVESIQTLWRLNNQIFTFFTDQIRDELQRADLDGDADTGIRLIDGLALGFGTEFVLLDGIQFNNGSLIGVFKMEVVGGEITFATGASVKINSGKNTSRTTITYKGRSRRAKEDISWIGNLGETDKIQITEAVFEAFRKLARENLPSEFAK